MTRRRRWVSPPSEVEVGHPQRWSILAVLCVCLVLVISAVSSLNTALPSIQRALDATQSQQQWVVDVYALVFSALLLPAGALGDRIGRKWTLLFGIAVYTGASLGAAFAGSAANLIAARGVIAVGAAFIMPSTLSLLSSVFPRRELPRAIAIWAGVTGAGGAVGMTSSGLLLTHWWWGSVFLLGVPLGIAAIVAVALLVPNAKDASGRALDGVGALLSAMTLLGLVFTVIEGPARGWTDPLVVASAVTAALGLMTFVLWELRVPSPMLDLAHLRDPAFALGSLTITVIFFVLYGSFFSLSQLWQFAAGYSPLASGMAMVPFGLSMMFVAPRSQRVQRAVGAGTTIAVGLAVMACGAALLGLVDHRTPYVLVALPALFVNCGAALASPAATAGIMQAVSRDEAGVGSAVNDSSREVGAAIGIAVTGSVLATVFRASLAGDLAALPVHARGVARDNIVAAMAAGRSWISEPTRLEPYLEGVRRAFCAGFDVDMIVLAAVAGAAALLVLRRHPRGAQPTP